MYTDADRAALDVELIKRGGFYAFAKRAWHVVEPMPYVDNWHCEEICNHCELVTWGEIKNLLINVPPGSSKSMLISVLWPVWEWTVKPETRWIFASFDLSLALRDARRGFELLRSAWFIERWGNLFDEDKAAKFAMGDYENKAGGFRFSTSVGGKGTGRHAHRRVFDDPNKPADALGTGKAVSAALETTNDWWRNTMASRRVDPKNFASIGVMQRIHENDLSAQCIRDSYTHLCFPMRFDSTDRCITPYGGDRRIIDGELLNPSRVPESALADLEKDLGPAVTSAQLQQKPTPAGGLIFKEENFRYFTLSEIPFSDLENSCITIDCTFKDTATSDYVAIEVWGRLGGKLACYESILDRMDLEGTIQAALVTHNVWKTMAVLVEEKANGAEVIKALRKRLPNVIALNPLTSKPARAQAANTFYHAHSVFHLADAPWLGRKEQNLKHFPKAKNDDDVDATTQGMLWLNQNDVSDFTTLMTQVQKDLDKGGSTFSKHFSIR